MFRTDPVVQRIPLGESCVCVIDDALVNPELWVEEASARISAFAEAPYNAYPGIELRVPDQVAERCAEFFDKHLREMFAMRRTLRRHAKLAMVTRSPDELQPFQTIPHIDDLGLSAGQGAIASVLYLYRDDRLGGTSFYRPRKNPEALGKLFADASSLDASSFAARYGVPRAYPLDSNPLFERVLTIPARWNRLIVYSGTIFHSGQIDFPDLLCADPRKGRLTLNGFFVCRRALVG